MSELVIEHVDETGAPCARHAPVSADALLQLAMVGSRASAFHHDCASKLQGLVMALDELSELTEHGDPQLLRALEAALDSTRELNALLATNRALTKLAARTAIGVTDLVRRAAQRVGVTLQGGQGTASDAMVDVAVPAMTHALALAIDVAAGAGRGRTVALGAELVGEVVELVLASSATPPSNASEALAIASFVIARDGGKLWCTAAGDRLHVRLPL
ncbi:MAG TPA: hypothetical protein VFT22_42900, partial [Kofleriaceae bacterium]|nr:hypothetical protein [Kofleriaceae bacterium]